MIRSALPALILLASCAASRPAEQANLPKGAFILPGTAVSDLLHQCSRAVPQQGEASWQPGVADVLALERALPQALAKARPSGDWAKFPGQWIRQYVGIVRHSRRYVYGNFAPNDLPVGVSRSDISKWGLGACDGGERFFGAEYDIAGQAITHLAFNGAV